MVSFAKTRFTAIKTTSLKIKEIEQKQFITDNNSIDLDSSHLNNFEFL